MNADVIQIAMKGMTFLGVAFAAALVSTRHTSVRALLRDASLGILGVALMLGNARLGAGVLGLLADAAYLGLCAATLTRHVRATRRARLAVAAVAAPAPGAPSR